MTNQLVTSCKECKWTNYEGKTQVGCAFDLLDKYRKAGINVMDAYDEEKEFNVIDRLCLYSRHKDNPATVDDVFKAIKVKYQIIYILSEKDLNIDYFSSCLNSFINQEIKPQHITVIRPFDHLEAQPFKYTKLLAKSGINWRFQDSVNPESSHDDLVDIAIDANIFPYYVRIYKTMLPHEFSYELNQIVNDDFKIFSYLYDNHKNIEIVTSIYHKQLGGNAFKPLRTKLQEDKQLYTTVFQAGDVITCLF